MGVAHIWAYCGPCREWFPTRTGWVGPCEVTCPRCSAATSHLVEGNPRSSRHLTAVR